jgi:superfamily II DNA helicase RecQ
MIPAAGSPELEEDLNRFLRSHRVIAVQKSLEVVEGSPCWCFCVEWLEGSPAGGSGKGRGTKKIDYKDVLSDADFAVFARLREVRKEMATAGAIPVYAVCTNDILAAFARTRPDSLAGLRETDGFGEAKADKYGKVFLEVLSTMEEKKKGEAAGTSD